MGKLVVYSILERGEITRQQASVSAMIQLYQPGSATNRPRVDMPTEKLKSLLQELKSELRDAKNADEETRDLMLSLDTQLQAVLNTSSPIDPTIEDTLTELESRFAVDHPIAERCVREILDALNKMGI